MSIQSSCKSVVMIPIRNQIDNIPKILKGLEKQTIKPSRVLFVFDRHDVIPIDSDIIDQIDVISIDPRREGLTRITNPEFYAASVRNHGINWIYTNIPSFDLLVMIDGDCIPQPQLVEGYIETCHKPIPVMSTGRRRERKYKWKDHRELDGSKQRLGYFTKHLIISDGNAISSGCIIWSCNLAVNRRALDRIIRFNVKYSGDKHAFRPESDGGWGGEDTIFGYTAFMCKIFIVLNSKSSIEHIDHKSPNRDGNETGKFISSMIKTMRMKCLSNPLDIDFFCD